MTGAKFQKMAQGMKNLKLNYLTWPTGGYSLLEMIVAMGIFIILILSATTIFQMVVQGQTSAMASENIQESFGYSLEMMAKAMRMAQKSDDSCRTILTPQPAPIYKVYNTTDSDTTLYFRNKDGYCMAYYLYNNRLKVIQDTVSGTLNDYLSSSKIKVNSLKFSVSDDLIGTFVSKKQAKVTITLEVEVIGQQIHKQKTRMQTTISSRYYE